MAAAVVVVVSMDIEDKEYLRLNSKGRAFHLDLCPYLSLAYNREFSLNAVSCWLCSRWCIDNFAEHKRISLMPVVSLFDAV